MHMAGGGDAQGGRGDARASPLGTPLGQFIALFGSISPRKHLTFDLDASPARIQFFTLMRIRIRHSKIMGIHADPDPQT
jgi:hypothetical protein